MLDKHPLRRLFKARYPDSYIVEFDYSQQEVRIVAELSNDVKMIEAFARGEDIHSFVGSLVFNKPIEGISKFERQIAKGCVFGAIFGASAREMAIRLHITEKQAQNYIDRFFDIFANVGSYIRRQHAVLMKNGYVTTILGRPRRFVISKENIEDCKREGANHTIQSVGADIIFLSLIKIFEEIGTERIGKDIFVINTVHDQVLCDVKLNALEYAITEIPRIMSSVPKRLGFKIDFPVDVKVGKYWGDDLDFSRIIKHDGVILPEVC